MKDLQPEGADVDQPTGIEAYRLGREYTVMPIAMVPEHCVEVPAGPVRFVVEARSLTQEAILSNEARQDASDGIEHDYSVDAAGASLHVLGAADGLEHLRFDAFDNEPHYHYIHQAVQRNTVVRIDDRAEADVLAWVVRVVAERLPEMLEHAGVPELAEAVRDESHTVTGALERVSALLREAEQRAEALR